MSNKFVNGKMTNEYDYKAKGYLALPNKMWEKDSYIFGSQTQGKGKVTAINNALLTRYNKGPSAGFMDSTGDFNFCTEYKSLQLVVCFNRTNRSISDGGGLIAAVAMYEQDTLKWNLEKALNSWDTLYLLQGRDENNLRGFRNSNKTLRFGASEEKLFKNDDNFCLLNYLEYHNDSIKNYIDTFAVKTNKTDLSNVLGIDYGFLETYSGYHSI